MVHLPAVNTPQFDWVQNHLPRPSGAARPALPARGGGARDRLRLDHPRRDLYVGGTTVAALYAQRWLPGLDRSLPGAKRVGGAVRGRTRDPDAAIEPVGAGSGRPGAHGRFDDRAKDRSAQLWVATHREGLAAAAVGFAGLLLPAGSAPPWREAAVRLDTACAWRGGTLLVTNSRGECGPDDPLSGFYVREVRHLRTLRFEINGERPWMCEWSRARGPTNWPSSTSTRSWPTSVAAAAAPRATR